MGKSGKKSCKKSKRSSKEKSKSSKEKSKSSKEKSTGKHKKHKKHDKNHKAHKKVRGHSKSHSSMCRNMKFKMKGKPPPAPKDGPSPSQLAPTDMTTIYTVPNYAFQDEAEVIAFNGYEVGDELGRGGFSVIYKAKSIKGGKPAALKVVEIGEDAGKIDAMKNEIFIMEMMDNMYTIKLYSHFMINENLYIIMQLADSGCFSSYVDKEAPMDEKTSSRFFGQMVVGIEHLHDNMIAHRDIKPGNFLMTEYKGEKHLLVSDYGLSRLVKKNDKGDIQLYSTKCGTPAFMAPEVLGDGDYHPFLYDVWSLGITLFLMTNNASPFDYDAEDLGRQQMLEKKWKFTDQMKFTSGSFQDMMTKIFEPNFEQRITLKACSQHEWLKSDYQKAKKMEKAHKHNS